MMIDPEWYSKEINEVIDEWYNSDTEEDLPEYMETHLSEKSKKHWKEKRAFRDKKMESLTCAG